MSKLKNEIKACMRDLHKEGPDILIARFCFPKDFLGFKGHFPAKPILPGVCKIQAAVLMLEEIKRKPVRLKEIILAKFFAPVSFSEEIIFSLKESSNYDCEEDIDVLVNSNSTKIAQLRLKVAIEE